jgi:hypothetical protein
LSHFLSKKPVPPDQVRGGLFSGKCSGDQILIDWIFKHDFAARESASTTASQLARARGIGGDEALTPTIPTTISWRPCQMDLADAMKLKAERGSKS